MGAGEGGVGRVGGMITKIALEAATPETAMGTVF